MKTIMHLEVPNMNLGPTSMAAEREGHMESIQDYNHWQGEDQACQSLH